MSRECQLTGKKTSTGHNRPFSLKATKRTFRPNLFVKKMFNPETGKVEKMKLSAKGIKTLKKWAEEKGKLISFKAVKVARSGVAHAAGEGKHTKKAKLTPKQKKAELAAKEIKVVEAAEMKEAKTAE